MLVLAALPRPRPGHPGIVGREGVLLMPGGTVPAPVATVARFSITIDGVEIGQFSDLVAISSTVEPAEVESGELSRPAARKIPPTVTLRRGHTKDMGIFTWHEAVLGGVPKAKKSASLTMYSADGKPVAKYFLESAWPSEVSITGLKSEAGEVLQETVTLTCDRLQRVSP
jgi:phage tail-like protein